MSWFNGKKRGDTAPITVVSPLSTEPSFVDKAQQQLDALAVFIKQISNRISPVVYSKLRDMDDTLRPLLVYLKTHDIIVEQEVTLQSFLTDYIPTPLNTFLVLPAEEQEEGGKADLLLIQQYDTLEKSARDFADSIYERTLAALSTQAIFIENKFGS